MLSNGAIWRLYNLKFGKPIDKTLVFEIDVSSCDHKSDHVICCFGSLSAEGYSKDCLTELLNEKQTSSKYTVAAVLRTPKMIEALRKEVRRLSGIRLDHNYLSLLVANDIVKRELVDSDEGQTATTYVKKLQRAAKERPQPVTEPAVTASAPAVIAPTS